MASTNLTRADSPAPRADERTTPKPSDAKGWQMLISQALKDADPWRQRCKRIRDRYRYEQAKQTRRRRYQLLWASLETLRPAVYAKVPKPVVENRWKNDNRVSHTAAELIERNISFQFEFCNYDRAFKLVRDDYLSFARGAARFRYEPIWKEPGDEEDNKEEENIEGGIEHPPEDQGSVLKTENCRLEYVNRDDLVMPAGRIWEELPWLCFRSFLTRDQLIARFGKKKAMTVTMDSKGTDNAYDYDDRSTKSAIDKATTYEIWDKTREQVIWICKSGPDIMDQGPPYLSLDGFFPCPRPAFGTMTTDTMEAVPDFVYFQDQSEEVDDLTARIAALQDSLKVVGFYPLGPEGEGSPEIERAVKPGFENKMIGVKAWTMFQESGRGGAPIIWLPVEQVEKVLRACVELRKQLIDDVHQITGVSDIMRGDTDPDETATAQTKKNNWTGVRLKDRRDEMARFCRDATRMAGEIICNHFQIETMMACADMPLPSDRDVLLARIKQMLAAQASPAPPAAAPPSLPPPAGGGAVIPFPGPGGPMAAPASPPVGGPPPGGAGAPPGMVGGPPGMAGGQTPTPPAPPTNAPGTNPQPAAPVSGPTQEQVLTLLRDGVTRRFRLDIETDSTIAADDEKERADRTVFLEATTKMVVGWMPIVKEMPEAVPLAGALMKFGAGGFPVARELLGEIDKFVDQLAQKAMSQGPPPTPPEVQVAQIKVQSEQMRAQAESRGDQLDAASAQIRAQAEAQKARLELAAEEAEHQRTMQRTAMEHQANMVEHVGAMREHAAKQQTLAAEMQAAEQQRLAKQTAAAIMPAPKQGPA